MLHHLCLSFESSNNLLSLYCRNQARVFRGVVGERATLSNCRAKAIFTCSSSRMSAPRISVVEGKAGRVGHNTLCVPCASSEVSRQNNRTHRVLRRRHARLIRFVEGKASRRLFDWYLIGIYNGNNGKHTRAFFLDIVVSQRVYCLGQDMYCPFEYCCGYSRVGHFTSFTSSSSSSSPHSSHALTSSEFT